MNCCPGPPGHQDLLFCCRPCYYYNNLLQLCTTYLQTVQLKNTDWMQPLMCLSFLFLLFPPSFDLMFLKLRELGYFIQYVIRKVYSLKMCLLVSNFGQQMSCTYLSRSLGWLLWWTMMHYIYYIYTYILLYNSLL